MLDVDAPGAEVEDEDGCSLANNLSTSADPLVARAAGPRSEPNMNIASHREALKFTSSWSVHQGTRHCVRSIRRWWRRSSRSIPVLLGVWQPMLDILMKPKEVR